MSGTHRPSGPRLDGQIDLTRTANIGIQLCREENWPRALDYLSAVATSEKSSELPASFYSYLGIATAMVRKQYRNGIRLCEAAIQRNPCIAENYVNLVRLRLMIGDMGGAWRALKDGLELAPHDPELLGLLREEFPRQSVVVPFLRRGNPLNVLLGRIRYRMREESGGSVCVGRWLSGRRRVLVFFSRLVRGSGGEAGPW